MPDRTIPEFENLIISPDIYSAVISWNTKNPAIAKVFWGKTLDYEQGALSEISYLNNHSAKIENLFPNTEYFFKIEITDHFGNENELINQSFRTMIFLETETPKTFPLSSILEKLKKIIEIPAPAIKESPAEKPQIEEPAKEEKQEKEKPEFAITSINHIYLLQIFLLLALVFIYIIIVKKF